MIDAMNRILLALAASLCAVALASGPTDAKSAKSAKPPQGAEQKQPEEENKETGGLPRYQPFPHNQNFVLKEINGKAPPVEMWISIDSTGRANGFSGCKNWSGIFIIGPNRLGPRTMPAVNERKCEGPLAAFERDYWAVLLSGPFWDTKGDDLILKGAQGGVLHFQRSL
ncbi:META domain-containing protein [Methylocystis rosea]|uniref:META domain-containing protein n=2 Tax=Methylocystis rosea TaxID=173366 RepID=A0A3G8M754_9HYPH|nr:META domain-containing protein [Methylocystis rosea]